MSNPKRSHCAVCGKRRFLYGAAITTQDGYWVCPECLKKTKLLHWYSNTYKIIKKHTLLEIISRIPDASVPVSFIQQKYPAMDDMDGHTFEYFCADLLRLNGFINVFVTPGSGDQGVDILAEKNSIKYAIQCKNYSSPLGNTPVQEVFSGKVYYHCHAGIVMTNSTFTTGAIDLANATGITLWDRSVIEQMLCQKF